MTALHQLKKAKTSHIRWRTYAEALVIGVDHIIDQLPVKHSDCDFGLWYQSVERDYSELPLYQQIGDLHCQLHDEFEIIFNLVTKGGERTEKKGFFANFLGKQISLLQKDKIKAKVHLKQLKQVSTQLLDKLAEFERVVVD